MAGSLSHITDDDGSMTLSLVENGGDRIEALEECFDIIGALCATYKIDLKALGNVCESVKAPRPKAIPKPGVRSYRLIASPFGPPGAFP